MPANLSNGFLQPYFCPDLTPLSWACTADFLPCSSGGKKMAPWESSLPICSPPVTPGPLLLQTTFPDAFPHLRYNSLLSYSDVFHILMLISEHFWYPSISPKRDEHDTASVDIGIESEGRVRWLVLVAILSKTRNFKCFLFFTVLLV